MSEALLSEASPTSSTPRRWRLGSTSVLGSGRSIAIREQMELLTELLRAQQEQEREMIDEEDGNPDPESSPSAATHEEHRTDDEERAQPMHAAEGCDSANLPHNEGLPLDLSTGSLSTSVPSDINGPGPSLQSCQEQVANFVSKVTVLLDEPAKTNANPGHEGVPTVENSRAEQLRTPVAPIADSLQEQTKLELLPAEPLAFATSSAIPHCGPAANPASPLMVGPEVCGPSVQIDVPGCSVFTPIAGASADTVPGLPTQLQLTPCGECRIPNQVSTAPSRQAPNPNPDLRLAQQGLARMAYTARRAGSPPAVQTTILSSSSSAARLTPASAVSTVPAMMQTARGPLQRALPVSRGHSLSPPRPQVQTRSLSPCATQVSRQQLSSSPQKRAQVSRKQPSASPQRSQVGNLSPAARIDSHHGSLQPMQGQSSLGQRFTEPVASLSPPPMQSPGINQSLTPQRSVNHLATQNLAAQQAKSGISTAMWGAMQGHAVGPPPVQERLAPATSLADRMGAQAVSSCPCMPGSASSSDALRPPGQRYVWKSVAITNVYHYLAHAG